MRSKQRHYIRGRSIAALIVLGMVASAASGCGPYYGGYGGYPAYGYAPYWGWGGGYNRDFIVRHPWEEHHGDGHHTEFGHSTVGHEGGGGHGGGGGGHH